MLAVMKLGAVIMPTTTALGSAHLRDRVERGTVNAVVCNPADTGKFDTVPRDYLRVSVGPIDGWHDLHAAYAVEAGPARHPTAATVVSSSCATSAVCQRGTSQRMSAARCRAGSCCNALTKARRIDSRASAISAGSAFGHDPVVRARGDPDVLGQESAHVRLVRWGRRPEFHRPGAALRTAVHVGADVVGDAVKPRPHRGAPLELVAESPGPQERLLHGILGLEARAEHPVAVTRQFAAVPLQLVRRERGGHRPGHYACSVGHTWHNGETMRAGRTHRRSAAGHRPHDEQWFVPLRDGVGERRIR